MSIVATVAHISYYLTELYHRNFYVASQSLAEHSVFSAIARMCVANVSCFYCMLLKMISLALIVFILHSDCQLYCGTGRCGFKCHQ